METRKNKRLIAAFFGAVVVIVVAVLVRCYKGKVIPSNVGNDCCPVSGRSVDGINTYIHEGKEYNLCGPDCGQKISQSPERYVDVSDDA